MSPSDPAVPSDAIGVAIVGTGEFAAVHADALRRRELGPGPDAVLVGFAGSRRGAAEGISGRYGVSAFGTATEAFADPRVSAVVVATPHDTHAALAVEALAAGVDALVEKPLANSLGECDRILAAGEAASGVAICMVGHLMRFAPAHVAARRLIEDDVIGAPVAARGVRHIPWNSEARRPWQKDAKAGGGMWMIQGVHVIDQLTFLLGERAADAVGSAELRFHSDTNQDADDLGSGWFGFGAERGSRIPVQVSLAGFVSGRTEVSTEIIGERGAIRVSHRGSLAIDTGDGRGWRGLTVPSHDHRADTLAGEWDEFLASIARGRADVDADYGRYVVATVDAVRRSMETRRIEEIR